MIRNYLIFYINLNFYYLIEIQIFIYSYYLMAEEIISSIFGNTFILVSCAIGFAFGLWNLYCVRYNLNIN